MDSYSHQKCYAKKTAKCSTKISGEHIISDNILKQFEHNKTVKFTGLPWIEKHTFNLLSRKSLISNILCEHHNRLLSPCDNEVGKLIQCIKEFDADFNSQEPKSETRQFKGEYIEKWMLKTACGFIASNQIAENNQRKPVALKDIYVDILFNNAEFPKNWGLYFKVPDNNQVHKFDCVSFLPMTGDGEVKCAEFLFNNFKFYLILGQPDDPNFWGFRHLFQIRLTDGRATKTIELHWDNLNDNLMIELTRHKTTNEYPENWEDWMKQ
jgi:hypothetical protein